ASRKLASTSWVLLPIEETIPIPVTTTRLISASSIQKGFAKAAAITAAGSSRFRRRHLAGLEQADLEVGRAINHFAVGRKPAIGDTQNKFRAHDTLQFEPVYDLFHARQHLSGKFDLTGTECPAAARRPEPTKEEAEHLPERVQAQAARHHRIPFE